MDTVVASLVQAAAATSGFTDRHCTNPERWLGWAPDTFGWNWALLVSSVIAFVGGSMSASVGVGGYVSFLHFLNYIIGVYPFMSLSGGLTVHSLL